MMNLNKSKKNVNAWLRLFAFFAFIIFTLCTCSRDEGGKTNSGAATDTIPIPEITLLSDLPDSMKPTPIIVPGGIGTSSRSTPVAVALPDPRTGNPVNAESQGRGLFSTYTTDQGLSFDQVYCGFKDKAGYLWFGTNGGGICKYDGNQFINYTTANGLAYNLVWSIVQDRSDNIWVGTDGGGVSRFDGKTFRNFTAEQGLASDVVYSIAEDKEGAIWFGTKEGLSKYDGKTFVNFREAQGLPNNIIKCISIDSKGVLWLGTNGGVSRFDGKKFTNYSITNGLPGNQILSIETDGSGNLWIGTEGNGLCRFDGIKFTKYTVDQGLAGNTIIDITPVKNGELWIATGNGASKFDGNSFTNYRIEQGLANNNVRSITEDEKGNIWFGTFGSGLSKFAGNSISNFTTAQGLPNNVIYSTVEDKSGNLWFGTNGGGISKYNRRNFTNYTTSQGLAGNSVYSLAIDRNGNLWSGTYRNGVSRFDGKNFTTYTTAQGLANNTVFKIKEDRSGNLWFGTSGGGVSKYDGRQFTHYTTSQGLANNVVFSIAEDITGTLWFGTLGGGVSRFDGERFTNFTTAQGLADDAIWAITEDGSGNLWFGTQNGLNLLEKKTLDKFNESLKNKQPFPGPLFRTFTTKDGLPHNFITQVIMGNDQKLYVGTNLGICELAPLKTGDTTRSSWIVGNTYNTQTGFPIKDVNSGSGAMFKDSKGIIWIGTGSDNTGLVRFDPVSALVKELVPPNLAITGIRINNEHICWSDLLPDTTGATGKDNFVPQNISEEVSTYGRELTETERDSLVSRFKALRFDQIKRWYPVPEKLELPYKFNNISFDFGAVETGKNFLVRYQYMLKGYDKEWSEPNKENFARFGNIDEGTYTFFVKAKSPEGVWCEPISFTFKVRPPWWRTWWAYTAYLIFFLWAFRVFSKFRERRLRFEKDKLEIQVKHRTQQLENTIDTLKATQSQLVQSEKMASLGELTAGIAHEIQNPLNFINNFSEVNTELIDELNEEMEKGNTEDAKAIAEDIKSNEQKINQHGKRADGIVKGMLQHSRSSSGQKEPTDINALADEYLRLAYHGLRAKDKSFNAAMKTNFDPSLEKINVVKQDIGRVILNLITNAFYTVDEKKKKNPEARLPNGQEYQPTVTVTTKLSESEPGGKRFVEITVGDNGNGIPDAVLEKIFLPFFTTKPTGKGTGLGLSMSYDIVTKGHGGTLKAFTKEGEGSEFIVNLEV